MNKFTIEELDMSNLTLWLPVIMRTQPKEVLRDELYSLIDRVMCSMDDLETACQMTQNFMLKASPEERQSLDNLLKILIAILFTSDHESPGSSEDTDILMEC
ncbi:MAG: hypothetical protein SVY53_06490 [Chloroflexota bacterium]|nr:hypothetical protein [Chloroflexota bacterium]